MSDEREGIRHGDPDEAVRSTAEPEDDVEAHAMRDRVREAVRNESESDDDVEAHAMRDRLRD